MRDYIRFHKVEKITSLITIIVSGATIFVWSKSHPWVAFIALAAILIALGWLFYSARRVSFRDIRKGIKYIYDSLNSRNFRPDLIIALNRSGSVLGGMLSVNYGVEEILVLNRVKSMVSPHSIKKKTYKVGSLVQINKSMLNNRKILVIFLLIDTGETLENGLKYLGEQGLTEDLQVATLFISSSAKAKFPEVIFAYELANCRETMEKLPWVLEKYHFV